MVNILGWSALDYVRFRWFFVGFRWFSFFSNVVGLHIFNKLLYDKISAVGHSLLSIFLHKIMILCNFAPFVGQLVGWTRKHKYRKL